uniref:lymphocyte function-associated antigen 3 n=1 Tax=Semicossyphus pulcher TaxID=241346 RepID=UPI0037E9C340
MCSPDSSMILAGWVCLFLAAASADSGVQLYKTVGDDVVLKPGAASQPITNILWKQGANIAAQWDALGAEIDLFRQFKERGSLNTSSGEMTIIGLSGDDAGTYTAEINDMVAGSTHLIIISPVPKPSIIKACDNEGVRCVLSCEGDITSAGPVTYKWKSGGTEKEKTIRKEDTLNLTEFSCELQNPVSQESSQPISNPFNTAPETPEGAGNVNISVGVTVFICLLMAVLLLVVGHRVKAGMWFFQKASMPWEADFWTKQERSPRDAAESNGTSSHQDKGQTDEEEPIA